MALIAFAVIAFWMPPTGVWSDGEEHYLWLAEHWESAENVPAESALMGGMPHAYAFLTLAGQAIDAFGEAGGQAFLRLLASMLLAVGLSHLARTLEFHPVEVGMWLIAFILLGQQLFAGEWLFRAVEPKVFAYAAVIPAVSSMLRRKYYTCALWLIVASHLHFLVGAQWTALLSFTTVINERRIRPMLGPAAIYAVAVLPLVVYLGNSYIAPTTNVNSPGSAWIISHFRMPHHSAPWDSQAIIGEWLPGILALLPIAASAWFYSRRMSGSAASLATLVCVTSLYLGVALIASYFDTQGKLGVWTPFRPTSLLLLLYLALPLVLLRRFTKQDRQLILRSSLAILGCAFVGITVVRNFAWPRSGARTEIIQQAALWQFARDNTNADALFLVDPDLEPQMRSFERHTSRAMLVLWKFIPGRPDDVEQWYRRMIFQQNVFATGCPRVWQYPVRYLITAPDRVKTVETCGPVVWANQHFALLQVPSN